MSGLSMSGIGSGLDTNALIEQLMSIERRPQQMLQQRVSKRQGLLGQYQAMNSFFNRIKTSAEALNLGVNWKAMKATSSDASVTATATGSALLGALSFSVKNLASTQTMASFGTVASTDTVIGSGSALFGMANSLGIATMKGSGLADGSHTLTVTQASSGATLSGTAVADSVTLNGSETLEYSLDGGATTRTITLTAGTYTQKQLADMVAGASGGTLNVGVNADKSLKLTTTREGSAASLQITGGSGLTALGLNAGPTATGTNGVIEVDGVANTVTDINPLSSTPITLNGSAGTVDVTFSGGLRTGTATVRNVNLGDGKLSTVVNNINAAGLGITASAVQTAPGEYRLQLASTKTGSAGEITTDITAFTGAMGQMQEIQQGLDAKITVGSGANAYDITSTTNTMSNVLAGVTLTLNSADPTKTVTVSVGGDANALADKVQAMVSNVNQALSFIKQNSNYDAGSKTAGAFLGNPAAQQLQSRLHGVLTGQLGSSTLGYAGAVGITSQSDGTFLFNREKFLAEYAKDPEAVANAFVEGGTTGNTTLTTPGIAEQLAAVGKFATDAVTGLITTAIKGENSTIADMNRQISSWDDRLSQRQARLKAQFTSLETAMAKFQSTGGWLAGQIAKLQ